MVGESYGPDNSRSGDAQEEDPGNWWLVGAPERARPDVQGAKIAGVEW